jgi:hypothetical protein
MDRSIQIIFPGCCAYHESIGFVRSPDIAVAVVKLSKKIVPTPVTTTSSGFDLPGTGQPPDLYFPVDRTTQRTHGSFKLMVPETDKTIEHIRFGVK